MLYELTAGKLYACYKADIHAYVMVMQNINRELYRRPTRADAHIAQMQMAAGEPITRACVCPWGVTGRYTLPAFRSPSPGL